MGEGWRGAIVLSDTTIINALERLNAGSMKIVLVINSQGDFIGTVSDGDIRRHLLAAGSLSDNVTVVTNKFPVVVAPLATKSEVMSLMRDKKVQQIPVINKQGKVVGLHLLEAIDEVKIILSPMVIMAGGKGLRLMPETANCPKPLLKIGEKPILEHIINSAHRAGIVNFIISINYLGDLIQSYFGDGKDFGVNIVYVREQEPLGTAGALSLVKDHMFSSEHIFVVNGDVLTNLDYDDFLRYHIELGAEATIAIKNYELQNPYGVVKVTGNRVIGFVEKPVNVVKINAGVYLLNRTLLAHLNIGEACDMPTFYQKIMSQGAHIAAFPMHESWVDIGNVADLSRARASYDEI